MKYLYLYFVYSLFIMKFSLGDNSTLLYYRCVWAMGMNCGNAAIKLRRITSYSRCECILYIPYRHIRTLMLYCISMIWCKCAFVWIRNFVESIGNIGMESKSNCSDACSQHADTKQSNLILLSFWIVYISLAVKAHSQSHSMERMHVVALTFCYFNTLL